MQRRAKFRQNWSTRCGDIVSFDISRWLPPVWTDCDTVGVMECVDMFVNRC